MHTLSQLNTVQRIQCWEYSSELRTQPETSTTSLQTDYCVWTILQNGSLLMVTLPKFFALLRNLKTCAYPKEMFCHEKLLENFIAFAKCSNNFFEKNNFICYRKLLKQIFWKKNFICNFFNVASHCSLGFNNRKYFKFSIRSLLIFREIKLTK